jgi:predicted nucleotidyltransferase
MKLFEEVFSDEEWREDLDPELARKLEKLLKRIKPFEESYKKSRHESIAQLWVALAEVYIQVDKMNRRLIRVEKLLTEAQKEGNTNMSETELSESLRQY